MNFLSLLPIAPTRPSMLTDKKDEQYHIDFARYCIGVSNNYQHQDWLRKIYINKQFYKGDQWIIQEDTDTFLKDTDNQDRNRLSIVQNIIRPMVNSYRGNAIRMNVNFQVKSISPQAVTRRETQLAKMLHLSDIINDGQNPFKQAAQSRFPIGNNQGETMQQFNNNYSDKYVKDMNGLAKFVSERNKFVNKQVTLAMNLAFTGAAVMKQFEYGGHQEFVVTPSENFLFDRSAKREDLTDAFCMGDYIELWPTEILEHWGDNLNDDEKTAIDNFSKFFMPNGNGANISQNGQLSTNGRVPVFTMYWRDAEYPEYGYVRDRFGYEYLTRINFTPEGETEPQYTDKDLIKASSEKAQKLYKKWGGKLKGKLYNDVMRVAIFIPREVIAAFDDGINKDKYHDILLDWGIAPYQDTDVLEYNSVKFPYKVGTWALVDGDLTTPLDDAIHPQRLINRLISMSENQLNNAPGSGVIIDEDLLANSSMDKAEIARNINQSKPVYLSGKGRGMQNAFSMYNGAQNVNTAVNMYKVLEFVKSATKESTGLNDALQGNQVANDQLVGVTQLMIDRGSLLQEPFYNAITTVYEQCFESIITVGKRIYIESEDHLAVAVGDDGAELIKLSKDMNNETFRMFVKRENTDEILKQTANQQLLLFLQMGLLDDKRVAKLWNRSNPDDVSVELRDYSKEKQELQRMSQANQQQQQQLLIAQAQQEQQQQQQMVMQAQQTDNAKFMIDKKTELQKELIKGLAKIAPQNRKAEKTLVNSAQNL